jgi:uncharacterized protein YjaZ
MPLPKAATSAMVQSPMNIFLCLRRVLIIAMIFAACTAQAVGFEDHEFTANGQSFHILTTNDLFHSYEQNYSRYGDISAASSELIFRPLAAKILDAGAEASFMFGAIALPYQPGDFLRTEVQKLKVEDVLAVARAVLPAASAALPGPETRIVIIPASPQMKGSLDTIGVSGYGVTLGSGRIVIALDPTAADWTAFLAYALAHEYHHSTWISRKWASADLTLLEYQIFEGRADAFAKSIYGGYAVPADRYLTTVQEAEAWKLVRPKLQEKGSKLIGAVMNGNVTIPFGSGYSIGYHIVTSFRQRNPGYTDQQILDMEPGAILDESGHGN